MAEVTFIPNAAEGVKVLHSAGAMEALRPTRVSTADVRAQVDAYLKELVAVRLEELKAMDVVEKELGRRVEVAVAKALPAVEREVSAAVSEVVKARVLALVATMKITVAAGIWPTVVDDGKAVQP